MKANPSRKHSKGFSLVELMVASTLATLMSLGVLSIYVNQEGNLSSEISRDTTVQEAQRAFDVVSRLLRQAEQASISVPIGQFNDKDTPEIANDETIVDFTLPAGQRIWPNLNGNANNAVRLSWSNKNSSTQPYQIQIGNTDTLANLGGANMNVLAGSNNGEQAQVINLDFWPLADQQTLQGNSTDAANSGYLLRITTRAAIPDLSYNNPLQSNSAFKHYRTHTVSGIITPRN